MVGSDLSPGGWKSDQVLNHSVIRRYTPPSQLSLCASISSGAIKFSMDFHSDLLQHVGVGELGLCNKPGTIVGAGG